METAVFVGSRVCLGKKKTLEVRKLPVQTLLNLLSENRLPTSYWLVYATKYCYLYFFMYLFVCLFVLLGFFRFAFVLFFLLLLLLFFPFFLLSLSLKLVDLN